MIDPKKDTIKLSREAAQFLMDEAMEGYNDTGWGCVCVTCPPDLFWEGTQACRYCPFCQIWVVKK